MQRFCRTLDHLVINFFVTLSNDVCYNKTQRFRRSVNEPLKAKLVKEYLSKGGLSGSS